MRYVRSYQCVIHNHENLPQLFTSLNHMSLEDIELYVTDVSTPVLQLCYFLWKWSSLTCFDGNIFNRKPVCGLQNKSQTCFYTVKDGPEYSQHHLFKNRDLHTEFFSFWHKIRFLQVCFYR